MSQATTQMIKSKENYITAAQFLCSLMIIGIHSYSIGSADKWSLSAIIPGVLSHGLFTAAVPVFMFISGYLFYKNVNNMKDCFNKQKRRAVSLLLPFLAWSTLYYVLFVVANRVLGIEMTNAVDVSPMGIVTGIVFYRYGYHLWYMFHLITYVVFAPIVYAILSKKTLSIIVLAVVTISGFLGYGSIEVEMMGTSRDLFHLNFFAYYLWGCFMGKNLSTLNDIKEKVKKVPVAVLGALYVLFGILGGLVYDGYIPTFNKRCIVPIIFVCGWALLVKAFDKTDISKITENISPIIIYGSHNMIGLVLGTILQRFYIPDLLNYFLGIILTIICCCVAARVIKLIKPIYWVLSGNR